MPNTPYQQSFWDDFEGSLWDDMADVLLDIYFAGIEGGVNTLPNNVRVLVDWDNVNVQALDWAKQYRYNWISKITTTTMRQTQRALSDWIQSGAPLDALETALTPIYGPVRAQMIAQTETTRIFSEANRGAWQASGVVEQVKWQAANDELVCPICGAKNGKLFTVDGADRPPAHVNCRCYLLPVVSEEALQRKVEGILNG